MDWRDWIIAGTVVTFVGGQIGHVATDPLDSKQPQHDEPRGIYRVVSLSGNLNVVGSGTHTLTAESGTYVIVGEEVKLELKGG